MISRIDDNSQSFPAKLLTAYSVIHSLVLGQQLLTKAAVAMELISIIYIN